MKTKARPWTAGEIKRAWRMKNSGKSNRQIGDVLKRSVGSVHYMIGRTHDYMSR